MTENIPLSQKLYLLGIHPKKSGIISGSYTAMDYILVGSLFMELYKKGNIIFEEKRIIVKNYKSDIPIHAFMLDKLSSSKKPLKISRWINKFYYSLKHIRRDVRNELVKKRMIVMQQKRFLFFRWKSPKISNKQIVYHLLREIENHVFGNQASEDDLILLSFIQPAGLLKRIFPDKAKRKRAKHKLKQMMLDNEVSGAVADAISAAQAVAASVAATSAASATVTS